MPNNEWYKVRGVVVGYLHPSDEDDSMDHDILVVMEFDGKNVQFHLRGLHHDFSAPGVVDDEGLLGATVEFTTNMSEQASYVHRL